jgi:serine/threonine protein phosphatase PrpC
VRCGCTGIAAPLPLLSPPHRSPPPSPGACCPQGDQLTTAWVGDSRGVLGRRTAADGWRAVDLTSDHKPINPVERERILRSQGRVERCV